MVKFAGHYFAGESEVPSADHDISHVEVAPVNSSDVVCPPVGRVVLHPEMDVVQVQFLDVEHLLWNDFLLRGFGNTEHPCQVC